MAECCLFLAIKADVQPPPKRPTLHALAGLSLQVATFRVRGCGGANTAVAAQAAPRFDGAGKMTVDDVHREIMRVEPYVLASLGFALQPATVWDYLPEFAAAIHGGGFSPFFSSLSVGKGAAVDD